MKYKVISHCNVAVLLHEQPSAEQCVSIVRNALQTCGYTPWQAMAIDLYPGCDGTLLLAHPTTP